MIYLFGFLVLENLLLVLYLPRVKLFNKIFKLLFLRPSMNIEHEAVTNIECETNMDIEYEAMFSNVNKENIRKKLRKIGANLVKEEFMQRRSVFHPPRGKSKDTYLRVRYENDKVTLSIKAYKGGGIKGRKEICLVVDDYDKAERFIKECGCIKKSYQETKREIWELNNVEIVIDEWPFLEPLVEIEGANEKEVKIITEKLGFDYSMAIFDSVGTLYNKKYGVSEECINNNTPEITFKKNPFN